MSSRGAGLGLSPHPSTQDFASGSSWATYIPPRRAGLRQTDPQADAGRDGWAVGRGWTVGGRAVWQGSLAGPAARQTQQAGLPGLRRHPFSPPGTVEPVTLPFPDSRIPIKRESAKCEVRSANWRAECRSWFVSSGLPGFQRWRFAGARVAGRAGAPMSSRRAGLGFSPHPATQDFAFGSSWATYIPAPPGGAPERGARDGPGCCWDDPRGTPGRVSSFGFRVSSRISVHACPGAPKCRSWFVSSGCRGAASASRRGSDCRATGGSLVVPPGGAPCTRPAGSRTGSHFCTF